MNETPAHGERIDVIPASEGQFVDVTKRAKDGTWSASETLTGELASTVEVGPPFLVYSDVLRAAHGEQMMKERFSPSHSSKVTSIARNPDGTFEITTISGSTYRLTIRQQHESTNGTNQKPEEKPTEQPRHTFRQMVRGLLNL